MVGDPAAGEYNLRVAEVLTFLFCFTSLTKFLSSHLRLSMMMVIMICTYTG